MRITPDPAAFAARWAAGRPLLARATLIADLETPVSAYLKLHAAFPGASFLLESVEGGAVRGRYSMIGIAPDLVWRCRGGVAALARPGADDGFVDEAAPPLASLRALVAESAIAERAGLPPMAAGLFGYLGYDMVRLMERLAPAKPDPIGVPDAILMRPTAIVVFDNVRDELSILVPARPADGLQAAAAAARATEMIERIAAVLEGSLTLPPPPEGAALATFEAPGSNTSEAEFLAMVARAKEHILAGDIFQVVLSQRFEAPFTLPAFQLYRALRRVNPAPFLCHLDFEDFQIVCSSPEILVRLRGGKVTVRPIAGTRPRGQDPEEDELLAAELLADPKERAEHLMLLDLGRNDVGRVARPGSVAVTERFTLEFYSQVMHIVSEVTGTLAPGEDALSALAAGFPAGTVSGAPKIRAMEIIDGFERDKRGIYAGCIGYFGADGEMDTCIVLRTAVVKDGRMHVQAGAGIVHESDAALEQRECLAKAAALFRAAEEATRIAGEARRGQ